MEVCWFCAMTGSIGPFVAIRSGADGAVVVERQVVLLSRDAGLALTMRALVSNGDRIARYESAAALAEWSTPKVAAVILDSQPHVRRLSYKHVRERYDGPLIVLLDKGERRPDLPPDGARRYLQRPFEVAELSRLLDTPVPELGSLEAAIIAAWSRHATAEPAAPVRPARSSQVPAWRPSRPRRVRVWAATIIALMGLLLVLGLSDRGSCAPSCTQLGGGVAGAAETETPLTSTPATGSPGGGGGGSQPPPGSSATSSDPPTPVGVAGFPVVTGIGGLIQSISPITTTDTTPPSGPVAVPGVPAPPGVTPLPGTTPPTTTPPGTSPPTTAPPSTAPPTTAPPTTAPPTTDPPTTTPPTTDPPTTEPPTTAAATTAAPTTVESTSAPTTVESTSAPTT
jgi:hypothetical protein